MGGSRQRVWETRRMTGLKPLKIFVKRVLISEEIKERR